jgi:preprotein translocase subunit SecD
MASLGILGLIGTTLASVLMPFLLKDSDSNSVANETVATPTSTIPPVIGRPMSIRPVVEQPLVARPDECAPVPPPPPAPTDPLAACDLDKKARYQLGPVGLQLNLTGATSAKVPLTDFYGVQIGMDATSSAAFAQYTGANIGKQLAFMRDGVVLAAPKISAPISGTSIQLSGEMNAATAETIARMVRDGT